MQTVEPFVYRLREPVASYAGKPVSLPPPKEGQPSGRFADHLLQVARRDRRDAARPRPAAPQGPESSGLVSDTYLHANVLRSWEGAGIISIKSPSRKGALDLPPRGRITEFSSSSARKLRALLGRVLNCEWEGAVLLTMTYPEEMDEILQEWEVYKAHLKAYKAALKRRFKSASGFWKLEFQRNGRPHYHCVIFGLGFNRSQKLLDEFIKWHSETWFRIVGSGLQKHLNAGTRAEFPKHREAARNYISSYTTKQEQQHPGFTGRYWGYFDKASIPFGEETVTEYSDYQTVLIRRVFRKLNKVNVMKRRWDKAEREARANHNPGLSRVVFEHLKSFRGKKGVPVMFSGQKWTVPIKGGKGRAAHIRECWSSPFWHVELEDGQLPPEGCASTWPLVFSHFKVPKKFRVKNNDSLSYFGDATPIREGIQRYMSMIPDRPDYVYMPEFFEPKQGECPF